MTTRPASGTAGRSPRYTASRRRSSSVSRRHTSSNASARDPGAAQHVVVADELERVADGRDRAHREFGVLGQAELADEGDVERGAQRGRDARRDRHAAARQGEDDDVGPACVVVELGREHVPRRRHDRRTAHGPSQFRPGIAPGELSHRVVHADPAQPGVAGPGRQHAAEHLVQPRRPRDDEERRALEHRLPRPVDDLVLLEHRGEEDALRAVEHAGVDVGRADRGHPHVLVPGLLELEPHRVGPPDGRPLRAGVDGQPRHRVQARGRGEVDDPALLAGLDHRRAGTRGRRTSARAS